eukprot:GHVL01037562.1.p1 GENE.GHVL01037562.1~~GHVL01037562.1.p1  ORF type:complete len:1414 (+),score=282.31 GHVL01037562.1:152-4243(+)
MWERLPDVWLQTNETYTSGIIEELGCLWRSKGKSLYLWDLVHCDPSKYVMYNGADQAVIALGVMKVPQWLENVGSEWILIAVTSVDISLHAIPRDETNRILIPARLPYTVSTDDVIMTYVVSHHRYGRVFLGSIDGRILEITFEKDKNTWLNRHNSSKKAKKILVKGTSMIGMIPAFILNAASKIGIIMKDPVKMMIVDQYKDLLYVLTEDSCIYLYYIPYIKPLIYITCLTCTNIQDLINKLSTSWEPPSSNILKIVYMSCEEPYLHVITSKGLRLNFMVDSKLDLGNKDENEPPIVGLKLLSVRSPSHRDLNVKSAFYSYDTCLLAVTSGDIPPETISITKHLQTITSTGWGGDINDSDDNNNENILYNKNSHFLISSSTDSASIAHSQTNNFNNQILNVNIDVIKIPSNECIVIGHIIKLPWNSVLDKDINIFINNTRPNIESLFDLAKQQMLPPMRYIVITNIGVYILTKYQPVDELIARLTIGNFREVQRLYHEYTSPQACAMIIQILSHLYQSKKHSKMKGFLICNTKESRINIYTPTILLLSDYMNDEFAKIISITTQLEALLVDPSLAECWMGVANVEKNIEYNMYNNIGRLIKPHTECYISNRIRGVILYVSRCLRCVWNMTLFIGTSECLSGVIPDTPFQPQVKSNKRKADDFIGLTESPMKSLVCHITESQAIYVVTQISAIKAVMEGLAYWWKSSVQNNLSDDISENLIFDDILDLLTVTEQILNLLQNLPSSCYPRGEGSYKNSIIGSGSFGGFIRVPLEIYQKLCILTVKDCVTYSTSRAILRSFLRCGILKKYQFHEVYTRIFPASDAAVHVARDRLDEIKNLLDEGRANDQSCQSHLLALQNDARKVLIDNIAHVDLSEFTTLLENAKCYKLMIDLYIEKAMSIHNMNNIVSTDENESESVDELYNKIISILTYLLTIDSSPMLVLVQYICNQTKAEMHSSLHYKVMDWTLQKLGVDALLSLETPLLLSFLPDRPQRVIGDHLRRQGRLIEACDAYMDAALVKWSHIPYTKIYTLLQKIITNHTNSKKSFIMGPSTCKHSDKLEGKYELYDWFDELRASGSPTLAEREDMANIAKSCLVQIHKKNGISARVSGGWLGDRNQNNIVTKHNTTQIASSIELILVQEFVLKEILNLLVFYIDEGNDEKIQKLCYAALDIQSEIYILSKIYTDFCEKFELYESAIYIRFMSKFDKDVLGLEDLYYILLKRYRNEAINKKQTCIYRDVVLRLCRKYSSNMNYFSLPVILYSCRKYSWLTYDNHETAAKWSVSVLLEGGVKPKLLWDLYVRGLVEDLQPNEALIACHLIMEQWIEQDPSEASLHVAQFPVEEERSVYIAKIKKNTIEWKAKFN